MKGKEINFPCGQNNNAELFKRSILEAIQKRFNSRIGNLRVGESSARAASIDSDGPWQSTYDTTKKEQAWLSNALDVQIISLEESLRELLGAIKGEVKNREIKIASVGSIIRVKNFQTGSFEWFLLVPDGLGGENLTVELGEILTISRESKLGKLLLGKKKGEKLSIADEELEIEEVI